MKQNELKTGKPLRGIELPVENGSNEQKEPPQVTPPPEIVTTFFDGAGRFELIHKSSDSSSRHAGETGGCA